MLLISRLQPRKPTADPIATEPHQLLPNHGFTLFTRHLIFSENFKLLNKSDRDQKLSMRWKLLTGKEKSEYNDEAQKVLQKKFLVNSNSIFFNVIYAVT